MNVRRQKSKSSARKPKRKRSQKILLIMWSSKRLTNTWQAPRNILNITRLRRDRVRGTKSANGQRSDIRPRIYLRASRLRIGTRTWIRVEAKTTFNRPAKAWFRGAGVLGRLLPYPGAEKKD